MTDNAGFQVDTTAPTVSTVAITSATGTQNNTLNAGDVVSVTVTMSEATTVTGTPQLALTIGGTTVQANYASGTGTTALVFQYTILAGQTDANGISIGTNSLSLNGGTLTDAAGNAATLTHSAVTDNAGFQVDTTPPTAVVTTVAFSADTGTSSSDFITQTAAQTLSGTYSGTIAADETLEISLDNGLSWTAATTAAGGAWSLTGQTLTASNTLKARVTDPAGNSSAALSQAYVLDTTPPTATISSGAYSTAGNILTLTGTNFSTLLEAAETNVTDITARLDWSKLVWDINGNNATTADVSFLASDISSAVVTDGTTLTITLTPVKGAALEHTAEYGATGTGVADTLDVTAGFARDTAGNVATTDAVTDGSITITTYVNAAEAGGMLTLSGPSNGAVAVDLASGITDNGVDVILDSGDIFDADNADASAVGTGKVTFTGHNGTNIYIASANGDSITARGGVDFMTAGAGADTFSFSGNVGDATSGSPFGTAFDTITGFAHGPDKLQFTGVTEVVSAQQAAVQTAVTALVGATDAAIFAKMAQVNTTNLGVSFATYGGNSYALFERTGSSPGRDGNDVSIKLIGLGTAPTFAGDVIA